MFININSNDLNLLHFLEENISILTTSILLKETNTCLLELDFTSSKSDIKISSPNQEILTISKPFHFTQIFNKINIFQQNYCVNIGSIYYFPFLGTLIVICFSISWQLLRDSFPIVSRSRFGLSKGSFSLSCLNHLPVFFF